MDSDPLCCLSENKNNLFEVMLNNPKQPRLGQIKTNIHDEKKTNGEIIVLICSPKNGVFSKKYNPGI